MMQRILLTLGLVFCLLNTYAADFSIITGRWEREGSEEIKLFRVISGRMEEIAQCSLQHDASFGFAFGMDEPGFYVVGSGNEQTFANKYVFYFKPGDRLSLVVNDSTYVLTGKNTPENKELTKWHDLVVPLEWKSIYYMEKFARKTGGASTYVDFFPKLDMISKQAETYKSKTKNTVFDKDFEQFRYYDLLRYAMTILMTPRTAHPRDRDFIDFYREIKPSEITASDAMLKYPFGVRVVQQLTYIEGRFADRKDVSRERDATLDNVLSFVTNPTLKGEIVLTYAIRLREYSDSQDFERSYGKYLVTNDQKERMETILVKLAQTKATQQTVDFTGTDLEGKTVALSDFKGKVVVVDVWATWCGPCRGEIPSLKKLEEEYHGKDVVFLSISLDDAKDKQKWIDFIQKEDLKGVQLFGGNGWQSDVAKFYSIKGIPRFMFFDKNGDIVTVDAPRPSHPDLKRMIDKYLSVK